MIEIRNLTKKFIDVTAINNLSIDFDHGIIGLVGQNGAGKSTLLRLIASVLYQNEGEILVDGLSNDLKESKEKIFFLSDNPYVPTFSSIQDLVDLYYSLYNFDKNRFYELINLFALPKKRKISGFSKGMKRQLFLALTLSIDARYYLLDEAFDGIDPLVMELIKNELLKLSSNGKTIIISSHNIGALQRLCDRFVILYQGRVTKDGANDNLDDNLIKYQIISESEDFNQENLSRLKFNVVSFKKMGSIYHVVFSSNSKELLESQLKENFNLRLLENIPIDSEELIALEMLLAKKGIK